MKIEFEIKSDIFKKAGERVKRGAKTVVNTVKTKKLVLVDRVSKESE